MGFLQGGKEGPVMSVLASVNDPLSASLCAIVQLKNHTDMQSSPAPCSGFRSLSKWRCLMGLLQSLSGCCSIGGRCAHKLHPCTSSRCWWVIGQPCWSFSLHSSQFRLLMVSLGSGTIAAEFRDGGLKDWDSDALMILVKTMESWCAHSLRTLRAVFLGSTTLSVHLAPWQLSCGFLESFYRETRE